MHALSLAVAVVLAYVMSVNRTARPKRDINARDVLRTRALSLSLSTTFAFVLTIARRRNCACNVVFDSASFTNSETSMGHLRAHFLCDFTIHQNRVTRQNALDKNVVSI